jgi:hypothetical protein
LSLYLFTESLILGLPPLSGAGSVFYIPPLLSVFDYNSPFVFQFYGKVQFWMLLSSSVDQIDYLLWFGQWLVACLLSAFAAFPVFIY